MALLAVLGWVGALIFFIAWGTDFSNLTSASAFVSCLFSAIICTWLANLKAEVKQQGEEIEKLKKLGLKIYTK